jgi:hypothetical protein
MGARGWFTAAMFVRAAMRLGVGFAAARPTLARLAASSLLFSVCEAAYGQGMTALAADGPSDAGRRISGLAAVYARNQAGHGDAAGLALRWEAIGPDGEPFPALDADLTLSPDGDHAGALTLAGVYRPPPGSGSGHDQASWGRAADTSVQAFLGRVAEAMAALALGPDGGTAR